MCTNLFPRPSDYEGGEDGGRTGEKKHRGDVALWLDLRLDPPERVERGVEHRGMESPLVRPLVRPAETPSRCEGLRVLLWLILLTIGCARE